MRKIETITHCPKGHGYTPENSYISPQGRRFCRECKRIESQRQSLLNANPDTLKNRLDAVVMAYVKRNDPDMYERWIAEAKEKYEL